MKNDVLDVQVWVLDSCVFINFHIVGHLRTLVRCRSPLCVPEYVYKYELTGPRSHRDTRESAHAAISTEQISVSFLSVEDLTRIAALGPRSADLGEIACALIAEREGGGVLTDDRSKRRLSAHMRVRAWQSTEEVLIDAAHRCEITEYDLDAIQEVLARNRYQCRVQLRNEYLMQRLARHTQQAGR